MSKIKIGDAYPAPILSDFLIFLDYIETHRVKLTKTEHLQRKDLTAIYARLQNPTPELTANANQDDAPALLLCYQLAGEMDLVHGMTIGSSRYAVIQKKRADQFREKSPEEQYILLLKAFWINVDWRDLQGRNQSRIPQSIELLCTELKLFPAGQKIIVSNHGRIENPLMKFGFFLYYFSYFGFWSFEIEQGISDKSVYASIITLTPLYKKLENVLRETWEPEEDMTFDFGLPAALFADFPKSIRGKENNKDHSENQFVNLISPIFEGKIDLVLSSVQVKDADHAGFLFKVELRPSCWRKIQISGSKTLLDLHHLIQRAFEFDNDHLYGFFMDGKPYGRKGIYAPGDDHGPYVDKVKIGDLNLYEGKSFMYLFDYGDEWLFSVDVLKIVPGEACPSMICGSKGTAPEQYGW
jgi:Plasmid pRiA4b ORF-3-like protein.